MSKNTPTLKAAPRERLGSRYAKRLRTSGKLPGVLYGHGTAPMSITLDEKETVTSLKAGAHVVKLAMEGGSTETCLVKDLQFGWMGDNVIHVDLARVDLDEVVTVKVRLQFVGTPESAKKPGAVLTHDVTELEIECKVRDIPEEIRVDLGGITADVYTVSEFKLAEGLKAVTDPHAALSRVVTIAEEAEGEAAAPTAGAEPEVLTAKKDKEGEGAAPAAGAKAAAPAKEAKKG
ncbi:MAG: 50S ribosomal protein L25 [Phycisphaerales bacterium]|jgi:large subunit ribosomal protein L25